MDDLELIEFVSNLAQGIDPKNGVILPDDTIFNRSDIVRGLYEVLNFMKKSYKPSKPFMLSSKQDLSFKEMNITAFVHEINNHRDEGTKRISIAAINKWLVDNEYLYIGDDNRKKPTEKGINNGIKTIVCEGRYGIYPQNRYSKRMQEIIIDELMKGNI